MKTYSSSPTSDLSSDSVTTCENCN
ncbi:hypothetical protein F383_02485 [Gossypium arboreum]|uniref:Uncharacterized protein n=1 Tax=Gossypium arboreum TaxID=29729 RepID=A0A0B0PL56_GOSAR|nr:hypothetical protein F383_02485 [Gossypium arboreum]